MANRDRDWLRQAHRDLEQAEDSRRTGHHEWACFAAQQAAEKAVKALHLYSSPRYPDSFPEGSPFEHHGRLQSEQAIRYAGEIVEFVDSQMA